MGLMQRYEYIGGSSRKFWEIDPVHQEGDDEWVVRVKFGRLGTAGQTHSKVFGWKTAAERYRTSKVEEKLRKGYTLKNAPKPIQKAQPTFTQTVPWDWQPPKPIKPACQHVTITRTGNKYKCNACGDQVEFDKPQVAAEAPEFETKVRRFFAGAA